MNGSWHCINIMVSDPLSVCVVLGLSFVAKEERSRNLQNYTRKTLGGDIRRAIWGLERQHVTQSWIGFFFMRIPD